MRRCNSEMVEVEPLDAMDEAFVQAIVERHVEFTASAHAARVLHDWPDIRPRFVKVMPRDYKRVLAAEARAASEGRIAGFGELVGAGNG
jgi:glutamate synthase (NADPH/NADH) large chain